MARLAGLGQGHDEQAQVKADIFPLGLEDFALARAGQQKQPEGKGFWVATFFQRPHEPPRFVPREVALPLRAYFERGYAHAGRLACGQNAAYLGQRADCLEYRQNTVAGGRRQPAGRQPVQPVLHFVASYFSKLFLKQFGMTPKDFEKQYQSGKQIVITQEIKNVDAGAGTK